MAFPDVTGHVRCQTTLAWIWGWLYMAGIMYTDLFALFPEIVLATDKKSLYQKFIEAMEAEVGQKKMAAESEIENKQTAASESESIADPVLVLFRENTAKQVQLLDAFDPLLHPNFTSLLTENTVHSDSARNQMTER